MGSNKSVPRTKEIEVIIPAGLHDVYDSCFRIRTGLNCLETILETDFLQLNRETAVSHNILQEAFYDYCIGLSEAATREKIKKSAVVSIFSESADAYTYLVPNFFRYLNDFGEVGISSQVSKMEESHRVGIFLKGKANGPKLIGFLDVAQNSNNLESLEYFGYVPVFIPNLETLHHISLPPDLPGINFNYVRLFCEIRDGKLYRIDGYSDKGIKFP